jgi:hypothetical protein
MGNLTKREGNLTKINGCCHSQDTHPVTQTHVESIHTETYFGCPLHKVLSVETSLRLPE